MSFNGFLNQDATVYNQSSLDRYGRENFGSGTSIKCRFERKKKAKLMPSGETQIIDGIVYCKPDITVNVDDKLTFDSNNYKVLNKESVVVGNGTTHHLELEVIKWQQN